MARKRKSPIKNASEGVISEGLKALCADLAKEDFQMNTKKRSPRPRKNRPKRREDCLPVVMRTIQKMKSKRLKNLQQTRSV